MKFYRRLDSADQLFLDLEDERNQMHVAACLLLEAEPLRLESGGIDFARVREYVESRLSQLPHYRQRLSSTPLEGRSIWIDDPDFNLDYHLRHTHLPVPGDERQLKRLTGRIISERLDLHKAPWEMWLVEGVEDDRFAVIFKVHHCMVDGLGGAELLQRVLRPTPKTEFEPGPSWIPRGRPGVVSLALDEITRRISQPFALARRGLAAVRDLPEAIASAREVVEGFGELAWIDVVPASDTLLNHSRGPHRRFDWWAVDLESISRIRQAFGGTVNDVVVSIATGAVARFLTARGVARAELESLDFRIACPVSTAATRPVDGSGPANRVSMLCVPVPIGDRDPVSRHARVSDALSRGKASHQALALDVVSHLGDWTTPRLAVALARREARRHAANLVVTNVPGPHESLYLLGAKLLAAYPVVPLMPGHALGIALFSYRGVLYWGFNSDWDLLPDLHELIEYTSEAFDELLRAATGAKREHRHTG